jgi:hypothetical protein
MPFGVLPELGEKAAESIEEVMQRGGGVLSVEELRERAQSSKKHIEILKRNGALDGLGDTAQLSFGDLGMMDTPVALDKPAAKQSSKKTDTASPHPASKPGTAAHSVPSSSFRLSVPTSFSRARCPAVCSTAIRFARWM